jgi:hypothetical protein
MTGSKNDHEPMTTTEETTVDTERADLRTALRKHRHFLTATLKGVSDDDAGRRTTVSELCLGGIVKHVTQTEQMWCGFIEQGASAFPQWDDPDAFQARLDSFVMLPGDSVASVLDACAEAAARTDALIVGLPSLDATQALPEAPWFEKGGWSARRVFLHLLAELSQHAGHADIVREAVDGHKTMG